MFACFAPSTLLAEPTEFYVDQAGSDLQSGTRGAPFATISRAMAAIRDLDLPSHPGTPVTVYLRGGTHTLTAKLSFGPGDTGTGTSPVTYCSFPGEKAVISGGRILKGDWQPVAGKGYYSLEIPAARNEGWVFNSLYVNGMSRMRARWPNWGEKVLRAEGRAPGEDERRAFVYCPGDIDPEWSHINDIDIVLLCSWTPTIHRIRELDPVRRVVRFDSSHYRAVDAWEKNFRYYLANVFEALDTPGEWYLDRHAGILYYYPLPGEDMSKVEVIAPFLRSRMVEFLGVPENEAFVEYLTFRGISFRHVDGDLDRYNGVYRQGHMFLDAALYAEGLRHSLFEDCEFSQLGEYAIEMTTGCQENRIQKCHIWDIGAGALQLGITSLGALLNETLDIRETDIILEAEAGELTSPIVSAVDAAVSGTGFAWLPEGSDTGSIRFVLNLPKAGDFDLWAKVRTPGGGEDSFFVQINDGPRYTYDTGIHPAWSLSRVVARELDGKPVRAQLAAGDNTLVIYGREAGARLDFLLVRPAADEQAADEQRRARREVLNNVVDNNIIHRLGTIWHGCYGIVNRFASQSRITHNDISDVHWDAIGLDARWNYKGETYSHGNVVAYNHLHHLGLGYHTDAGAVYQFGPLDTHIHHNRIHDTVAYPNICGYTGVYLDEQSRNALVENNLVYNVAWPAYFQHKGVDNLFRNNIGAFARDGLIHRGGLNQTWKINTFTVERNIYISRDEVALGKSWQPGEIPPKLQHNMYYSLTGNREMTFAGKSLSDWQAEGYDTGSCIGNPGCRYPEHYDFTLTPDAPALSTIGFVPFDAEISKAGVYGDSEWCALPESLIRRKPTALWTPRDMLRFTTFKLDFEEMPVGWEPLTFRLAGEGEATFAVTDEAAFHGTKAYKCTDRQGLRKTFYPYIHTAPRGLDEGRVRFAFAAMLPAVSPAPFNAEIRGKGFTSDVGPTITMGTDGLLVANGVEVLRVPPGTWCHLDIRFVLGIEAPREYVLVAECAGETRALTLPFMHKTFSEIRWLGFSANADCNGVFYLDDIALELD